jgi:hypothetical protein
LEQSTDPVSHSPDELTLYDRGCLGCDRCELGTDRGSASIKKPAGSGTTVPPMRVAIAV